MKISDVRFIIGAASPAQFPAEERPEVAFAGRSNVGKSSLINSLFNRRRLAKVSQRPGLTREINYFLVNESFYLVDLPGYGFAKASKDLHAAWQKLMLKYLYERRQLSAVALLLDIRREPSADDQQVIGLFRERGLPTLLALTKADKLPLLQRRKQVLSISKSLHLTPGDCFVTSAEKGWGREELWGALECFVKPETSPVPAP